MQLKARWRRSSLTNRRSSSHCVRGQLSGSQLSGQGQVFGLQIALRGWRLEPVSQWLTRVHIGGV